MSSLVLTSSGLAVDAHPLAAPKGAMRVVDNAVCDLPGIIRARPSFEKGTNKSSAYTPRSLTLFGSDVVIASYNGYAWQLESQSGVYTGNAEPVDNNARETSFAESRKSLYFCTSTGIRRLGAVGDSATVEAGMDTAAFLLAWRGPVINTSVFGPFTGPYSVAYCLVVKRTDANGYIKRSVPTQRVEVRNSGGTTDGMTIFDGTIANERYVQFGTGTLLAGDEIEVYRTTIGAAVDTALPNDMFLVTTYVLTTADVTAGTFPPSGMVVNDQLDDGSLGEALYTNSSREGVLNAKNGPISAQEIAEWSGSMWFARTKDRHRLTLALRAGHTDAGGENYNGGNSSYGGIGFLSTTGDIASGSPTISNVVSIDGVRVGSYVAVYGGTVTDNPFDNPVTGGIPRLTKVTAISGAGPYTITMSANATATQVGEGIGFGDHVTIDGLEFVCWNLQPVSQAPFTAARRHFGMSPVAGAVPGPDTRAAQAALALAGAINDNARTGALTLRAAASLGSITIERIALNGSSFAVSSLKPQGFVPSLGDDSADTLTSTQDVKPHRVYYSLPQEPEAVPLLNFIDIGAENFPIQRLMPCGDSLLVFKEDGIYRINGSYPTWSVSCIDPEIRLVRPETAAVLNNIVYAWTNRGVCEIDESGIRGEPISNGKIGSLLASAQNSIIGSSTWHGARVLVSPRHQLVLVTVPATAVSYSTDVYCYSTLTGAWTKWPNVYLRCGDTGVDGVLWAAWNNSLNELEWETRYLLDYARGFDRSYQLGAGSGAPSAWTVTPSSTAMSITNAQRNEWVPTVGDWVMFKVSAGDVYRRIIAVVNAGGGDYSWTLDSAAPSDVGAASQSWCFVGSPTLLEWLPSAAGQAGAALMVWRGLNFSVDQAATVVASPTTARITLGVKHDGAASAAELVGTPARSTVQTRPYRYGWPREAGRRTDVAVRLGWSEIYWQWRMAGVTLVGEETSERVRR